MKKRYNFIPLKNGTSCIVPKISLLRVFDIDYIEKEFNNPYGFIYKITNLENDMIYIGKTVQDITYRMNSHFSYANKKGANTRLARAIIKYGKRSFEWEIIENCYSVTELSEKEKYYIILYNSIDLNVGYNMVIGDRKTPKPERNLFTNNVGRKNPMYETSLYELWVKSHGIERANSLMVDFKAKQTIIAKSKYLPNVLTFKGKKHKQSAKDKMSNRHSGICNPMFGRSVYDIWIEKYGLEKGTEMRLIDIEKKRISRLKNKKQV